MKPALANLVLSLAPYALHVMVCARLPDSTSPKEIFDASWCTLKVLIACGIVIAALPSSTIFALSCPAPASAFLPRLFSMTHFSKLPSAVADFCILVSGLLDAFVIAFKLRRTNRGIGLNHRELMCGRIKLMTALEVSIHTLGFRS